MVQGGQKLELRNERQTQTLVWTQRRRETFASSRLGDFALRNLAKRSTTSVHQYMRLVTLGTLGLILAATVAAQTTNPAKLKINGIGLYSTLAQVKKALGKPTLDGKPQEEGCIGAREKYVEYDGVKFYLMDGDSKDRKTFEVKSFSVTSPKYVVSGIKVGDTEHNVRRRLGTKFTKSDDPETGADVWSYEFPETEDPGFTTIYITRGKVTKIGSGHQVC
jgi:hypothetical protein